MLHGLGVAVACVVDVDDPATWPPELRELAERIADELAGTAKYTCDLRVPEASDTQLRKELEGHRIRAFHATRLLDTEVDLVRQFGLRLLTPELVRERIDSAFAEGHLTSEERDELSNNSVFATGYQRAIRQGLVWLFLGEAVFSDEGGLWRLLETWGGEGIYWTLPKGSPIEGRLRGPGRPSIVVVDVPFIDGPGFFASPGLSAVLVGSLLGFEDVSSGVHLRTPVAPHSIVDMWQLGDGAFSRRLPWLDA